MIFSELGDMKPTGGTLAILDNKRQDCAVVNHGILPVFYLAFASIYVLQSAPLPSVVQQPKDSAVKHVSALFKHDTYIYYCNVSLLIRCECSRSSFHHFQKRVAGCNSVDVDYS